jgi:LacI family transcriptional regulator
MNISELAKELGFSVSTVSRVLSGNAEKYRISRKTVEKVREAAEAFQVTPDPIGAGLRRGKMGIVGLLVPDITNPFFSQLARAIELNLRSSGVAVQLCNSAEDSDTELSLLGKMLTRRLDGMIIAPVGTESEVLRSMVEDSNMPIVLVDRPLPGTSAPSVSLENRKAGRLAAEQLLAAGHTRIGCLRGDPGSESDRERFEGVRDALRAAGIDPGTLVVAGSGYSREESLSASAAILERTDRPTGIVTLSGQGILGVLETARELRLNIPDQLSVVAFDDQPWSPLIEPPITTIAQPVDQMANRVVELLNRNMQKSSGEKNRSSETNKSYFFDALLKKRSSVSSPPESI